MFKWLFLIFAFSFYPYIASAQSYEDAQAHAIVLKGSPQDVYKLIKSGYDLNKVHQCQTLLITAIKSAAENLITNEHPEYALKKINLLLNSGANYDQRGCQEESLPPIFWAISLPLLLQKTENDLNDILDEDIKRGTDYCDIPKIISKPCSQITTEEREQIRSYFRDNTLESIKILNPYFVKIVKTLLKRKVDLTQMDEHQQTVLHYAAAMPEEITTEPLKLLLDNGIFVDPQNPEKHTPLFFAYGAKNKTAINLLLDAGADPTMVDIDGILPDKSKSVVLEKNTRKDGSISIHLEN